MELDIKASPEFLVSLANKIEPFGEIFEKASIYFLTRSESIEVFVIPLIPEMLFIKVISN